MKKKLIIWLAALIFTPLSIFIGIHVWKSQQWGIYCTSMNSAYQAIEKDDIEQACQNIQTALSVKSIQGEHRTIAENLKNDCEKAKTVEYFNQVILEMDDKEFVSYTDYGTIRKRFFECDFLNDAFIRKLTTIRKDAKKIREKLLFDIAEKKRIEKEQAEKEAREKKEKEIAEEKDREQARKDEANRPKEKYYLDSHGAIISETYAENKIWEIRNSIRKMPDGLEKSYYEGFLKAVEDEWRRIKQQGPIQQ